MELKDLNIVDNSIFFGPHNTYRPSTIFNWKWSPNLPTEGVTLFLDNDLHSALNCTAPIKLAWLVEPPAIHPHAYSNILKFLDHFEAVYTFDEELIQLSNKFKYCPWGTTFIPEEDYKRRDTKLKAFSIVASNKKFAPGHLLRHEVIENIPYLDVYGRGFNPIDNKSQGLNDYMFSVAIENSILDNYYTEKLLDCFLCRTIPLYWGTKKVSDIFNPDGIIFFNTAEELKNIIEGLNPNDYINRQQAIEDNYTKALEYINPDMNLWNAGLKDFYDKSMDT